MKYLALAALVVTSLPLQAASLLEQAIEACRSEQNALHRLSCYDAIQLAANSSATTHKPDTTNTLVTDSAQASSENDFGIEHRKTGDASSNVVYMTVKAIRYSPRKNLIVEFENGQIWRQSDSGYYKINIGEQHFIKRGALNSFFLGNDSNNRTVRVRREP